MESAGSDLAESLQFDKAPANDGTASDFVPPYTSEKVFKFSEHIHKDRHIFLGHAYLSMVDMVDYGQGNYYSIDYSPVRLPSLNKVSLSLDVFHTPPQRRFNENINTYVDTRKRIRMFQCVDDYDYFRYTTGSTPLPFADRSRILGTDLLQTSPIRKPETKSETPSQLPPLKRNHGGLEETAFPFKLHREGTLNCVSAMPTRFAIKPVNFWRQNTDTLLYGRRLNLQQRAKNVPGQ